MLPIRKLSDEELLYFYSNEKNLFTFGKNRYKLSVYYHGKEFDCRIISMLDDSLVLEVDNSYLDEDKTVYYSDYVLKLYWFRNMSEDHTIHYRKKYSLCIIDRIDNIITIKGKTDVLSNLRTAIVDRDGQNVSDIISYINRTLNFNRLLDEN